MASWRIQRRDNQRGQMAVFVALIFPVLFVFFAMVVNIGIIVYHKINLQNAVDLAAYYAAERQAEILNAIAHENYQIRQAYKLLAWRYRVLGAMGHVGIPQNPHPSLDNDSAIAGEQDVPWLKSTESPPAVCVANRNWSETANDDNLCKGAASLQIHTVPSVAIDIFGINAPIIALFELSRSRIQKRCEIEGKANWFYTALIYYAFKMDVANRKKVIRALADDLSKSSDDFSDLTGASVKVGAQTTLIKNLTRPNAESLGDVQFFNSMARDKNSKGWLPDIPVQIAMIFDDSEVVNNGDNCKYTEKQIQFADRAKMVGQFANNPSAQQFAARIYDQLKSEPQTTDPFHASIGVEKNPWYMAYVGIKATTQVQGIFSPLGNTITLEARAFAKPFGGRIGPWYRDQFPAKDNLASVGQLVDELVPPREFEADQILKSGDSVQKARFVPNYSRYPGDKLGLNSRVALTLLPPYSSRGRISIDLFDSLVNDPANTASGDALSWNEKGPQPWIRDWEIAAVAPDLFDATYYSVEPVFSSTYLPKLKQGFGSQVFVRGDLGSRMDDPKLMGFSVINQVNKVLELKIAPRFYYLIRDYKHLLTGWVYEKLGQFATPDSFPTNFFGKCAQEAGQNAPIPGNCASGGRVGYSVKLVSRSYLLSKEHQLGNDGSRSGIYNPPPF